MSLRLIQPGASAALRHPKTGAILEPLYTRKDGSLVWPVLGASPDDDTDDPKYTGGGSGDDDADDQDDDGDEDEDDDEDDKKSSKSKTSKSKKDDDDEDDDDEDEEDSRVARASRQAKKYRLKLREAEAREKALNDRLTALENKGKTKKTDEDDDKSSEVAAELAAAKERADKAERAALLVRIERMAERGPVDWIDLEDVMAALQRDADLWDDIVDEDGTVDKRELTRALRDLAKRKPHLVKPKKVSDQDDDEDDDSGPRSPRQMNGKRRGARKNPNSREELAKKFPVLGRM